MEVSSSSLEDSTGDLWLKIISVFPVLGEDRSQGNVSEKEILQVPELICGQDLVILVEDYVLDNIRQFLHTRIVPEFWNKFAGRESEFDGFERFKDAVKTMFIRLSEFSFIFERLEVLRQLTDIHKNDFGESTLNGVLKDLVRSSLHSQLPLHHPQIIEDFYKVSFKVFFNRDKFDDDPDESAEDIVQCGGCGLEVEQCHCQSIIDEFHATNKKLIEMGLLECLAGEVISSLLHHKIESHVEDSCKGSFDTSHIGSLESWLETVIMKWLSRVYKSGSVDISSKEHVQKFKYKLYHFLYETYTRTRIEELFNIIIEYPDSQPAIEDLRVCLQKTDLRSYLTQKLQRALQTRLLHPGVNTPDILTAYVAAIRALRHLDSTGVLLETVTQPVRQYLRCRDDTVRCVVSSLTEEGPSELADELGRGEVLQLDEGAQPDEDSENWESWNPDPVDADPSKSSKSRRTSDIISMLVNVYGSKELFVNEYRTLLADRLLTQFSYNTEKEIRYLELLKLRFGESQLHYCEVMLKDVYDSKRINAHLHSDTNSDFGKQEFPCTAMILSAQFWPPFKEETLELPSYVKDHLDRYTKAFETLKGNRTLCWKPHLGSVFLDVQLKDRTISFTVSPTHATIIWHFQTKNQWTVEELSQIMHVPSTVLRRKIAYWQSQGLLREVSTDSFLLVEENPSRSKGPVAAEMVCEDEESESAMASAHDQREEELQVFWSYIVGMLTNLDSMPLERIHQMLKMFASQGPTAVECSLQELRHFLDRKVREHRLLFSGGFYRLPKP